MESDEGLAGWGEAFCAPGLTQAIRELAPLLEFFDELVTLGRPVIEDGYVPLPEGPGIGAELDLEVARRYARPGEPFFGEPRA